MGTTQEQAAHGSALGVYLPRLQTSILQPAGGDTATTIALEPDAATSTLTAQQASEYSITVAPNSLVGMDGQKMSSGMVGFSTVSPSLIREMLPQGVMQLATTLTIQAPGVATFSTPLVVSFANVYDAAPGSQLDVYSFNHTTGDLEITGTATVSADGTTVTTDPGSGITHPGWFGVTPPGSTGASPPPACPVTPAVPPTPPPAPIVNVQPLLSGDTPVPSDLNMWSVNTPPPGFVTNVSVTVDPELQSVLQDNTGLLGSVGNFLSGVINVPITGGHWTLTSSTGTVKFNWAGVSDATLKALGLLNNFAIYGGMVQISVVTAQVSSMAPPSGQCAAPGRTAGADHLRLFHLPLSGPSFCQRIVSWRR